jgi:hypothetical protein
MKAAAAFYDRTIVAAAKLQTAKQHNTAYPLTLSHGGKIGRGFGNGIGGRIGCSLVMAEARASGARLRIASAAFW